VDGGDQGGVGVRAAAVDHRQRPAVRVPADLEVVFVDEGAFAEAEVREVVPGGGAFGRVQLRGVHEHEADAEAALDLEGVAVDDAGHDAFLAESRGQRARRDFGGGGGGDWVSYLMVTAVITRAATPMQGRRSKAGIH